MKQSNNMSTAQVPSLRKWSSIYPSWLERPVGLI